jgi:hypothetical protein
MTALSKLLVMFAIFLPESLRNTFMILSLASEGKQVWANHSTEFDEPINKPNCKTTCELTNELSIDLW